MNIFEQATRKALRFESNKGLLTTEDLWKLPLLSKNGVCLDDIAKNTAKKLKEESEDSFVLKKSSVNKTLQLKLDILKHIIDVKLKEVEEKEKEEERREKRQKILELIKEKEQESLKDLSIEELKKLL